MSTVSLRIYQCPVLENKFSTSHFDGSQGMVLGQNLISLNGKPNFASNAKVNRECLLVHPILRVSLWSNRMHQNHYAVNRFSTNDVLGHPLKSLYSLLSRYSTEVQPFLSDHVAFLLLHPASYFRRPCGAVILAAAAFKIPSSCCSGVSIGRSTTATSFFGRQSTPRDLRILREFSISGIITSKSGTYDAKGLLVS